MATQMCGQPISVEMLAKQVNKQIFDADGQLPGFWTLTNKYHETYIGSVQSENVIYSNNDKVFRQFNREGKMIKYQTFSDNKL